MTIKERIYTVLPLYCQNFLISLFNLNNLFIRRSGSYRRHKEFYRKLEYKSLDELKMLQAKKFRDFLSYAMEHSRYYSDLGREPVEIERLAEIPVLEKEDLRQYFNQIRTLSGNKGISKFSGGTTGKPIHCVFTKENIRERSAVIDVFREKYGYTYGKQRIAWFSGRKIINHRDERRNRFWRTDPVLNIRYYSTFHLNRKNLKHYVEDLKHYKPTFFSGFPSAIYELASYMEAEKIEPGFQLTCIFTTSETLMPIHREKIEKVFQTRVYNQYASAEGAPFIMECEHGKLHLNIVTGIVEVVDDELKPALEGEMLVTSFTTYGTPIIRYRIGDYIRTSNASCNCGSRFPVIDYLEGRKLDFIYSTERGKIFNSQVGDCVKADIKGLLNFQVVQHKLDEIEVKLLTDDKFEKGTEQEITVKLRERLGDKVDIKFRFVDEIPKEKSGKFALIKNHLADQFG